MGEFVTFHAAIWVFDFVMFFLRENREIIVLPQINFE